MFYIIYTITDCVLTWRRYLSIEKFLFGNEAMSTSAYSIVAELIGKLC